MLFLQIQSSGNQRVVAFFDRTWRITDTVIVSSQGVCGSDLIDHREHEAAAEASHKMLCASRQQSGGCFFSVEVCGFSCCLTCPIRHGATQTCTRTRTTKTQSLSTLRSSQLKWSSWKLALRIWPNNLQLYLPIWRSARKLKSMKPQWGKSMVSWTRKLFRTQSRESRRSRRQFTCSRIPTMPILPWSRSTAYEVRAAEWQQTWHHWSVGSDRSWFYLICCRKRKLLNSHVWVLARLTPHLQLNMN